jgi:hypothetical protein
LKRFDILEIGEVKTLTSRDETVKCYLPVEEIYDVIEAAHLAVGHGGRDRLKMETTRKYANVTIEMINTGYTQQNGAVLIVFTIKTAPFFCVCPVLSYRCAKPAKQKKTKAWLANPFFIQKLTAAAESTSLTCNPRLITRSDSLCFIRTI